MEQKAYFLHRHALQCNKKYKDGNRDAALDLARSSELRYVNTHEQLADIFTKPLGVMQHNYLKGRLTGFR